MSFRELQLRHLRLISLYGARYVIRGGAGLVYIMLVLSCGLITAHIILLPVEQEAKEKTGVELTDKEMLDHLVEVARPAVQWMLGGKTKNERPVMERSAGNEKEDPEIRWAAYLLDEKPALLSAVILIMFYFTPFLVALGSFNQYSGDIQSKGLRYQLLRTSRTNIYFGRFLAAVFYTVFVNAILIIIIVLYLGLKLDIYAWSALARWGLWGILALIAVSIPYIAFCGWISSMIDSPFGSMTISSIVISAIPLFALFGRATWKPASSICYALPWGIQNYILHPDWTWVLGSLAACGGYTILFLLLGHHHFTKRDL
ncbi:MAG: hypothetical protein JW829_00355 [Pirellulales bacterium]|nr:hypothetical protein [Pirellulales bacterium]